MALRAITGGAVIEFAWFCFCKRNNPNFA